MNTQQIQSTLKNAQRTAGNVWLWLGLGLLLIVATLAVQNITRRATTATIPNTGAGAPAQPQSVPEAAVQGVADYINAHSGPFAQSVPDAGVQSVTDYIRLHSNDTSTPSITDPAMQSVMDYLKAHDIQP